MKKSFYGLAVEGWPVVLLLAALAAWLAAGPRPATAVLPAALMLFAAMQFRDPSRSVPADPLGVLSPVDGVVTSAGNTPDGLRITIRIGMFSPYLLRSPVEGKVLESDGAHTGRGVNIRTDEGDELQLRLVGPRWLPSASVMDYGERLGQGQRCGLLRAARMAELWLPADATLQVRQGDRVMAGETVLGHFHGNGIPA